MDIATNCNRGAHRLDIALFDEDLFDLLAKDAEVSLRKDATVLHG